MPKWLDRLLLPPPKSGGSNLPSTQRRPVQLQEYGRPALPPDSNKLPNASLIYGIGAALMLVMSLYFLANGMWGTALIIMFPTICLFAFAYYFLQYGDKP